MTDRMLYIERVTLNYCYTKIKKITLINELVRAGIISK